MGKRPKIKELFLFDDKWLLLLGIPLVTIITSISYYPHFDSQIGFWRVCLPISFLYVIIYWFFFRYSIYWLILIFKKRSQLAIRIFIEGLLVIIGNIVIGNLIFFVLNRIDSRLEPHTVKDLPMLLFSIVLCLMITAIYEATRFYTQLLQTETEKEKLEKENMQSILIGLQNQVNPHFLFNSLNTLAHLIPDEAKSAQRFIKAFAKVYRYILDTERDALVTLEQELEFCNSYCILLKERFGRNFNVNLNIDKDDLLMYIPPISLQILVENTVKHNVVSLDDPLTVNVWTEKGNMIYVQNNVNLKESIEIGNKIGIANIKERYRLLSNRNIEIENTEDSFKVGLPLLVVHTQEKYAHV